MKWKISWMSAIAVAGALLFLPFLYVFAAAGGDLAVSNNDIWFDMKTFTEGKKVRIYGTVENKGTADLKGFVKFFDGENGPQLKGDQPISVVVGREDTVFIDIIFAVPGDHEIVVKVTSFENDDADLSNNSARRTITVLRDFDKDGSPDVLDADDDNDGVPDTEDAFPQNAKESADRDGDGIGNNLDNDDDNDGTLDVEDAFPLDSSETKDSDGDGVGDKKDAFPFDKTETADFDRDGRGNVGDFDADNDGIPKTKDVNDLNLGPIISVNMKRVQKGKNLEISFDLSKSRDPDGTIVNVTGTIEKNNNGAKTMVPVSLGTPFQYPLQGNGVYKLTVTATDDKGESRSETFDIPVRSPLVYAAWLFLAFLIIILAIFGIITYTSRARRVASSKKRWEKRKKTAIKKFPFLKKIL